MKYTILMSCGHEQTVELFGPNKDRERRIEYLQDCGLCKECYQKKMDEKNRKEGLAFHATVLPKIDARTGEILVLVWYTGYTRPFKEALKAMGYLWTECRTAKDWYSARQPAFSWNKEIVLDDLEEELNKAKELGADQFEPEKGLFETAHYQIAVEKHNRWLQKKEDIAKLQKPKKPELLQGSRWNGKIYGKIGSRNIYLDGQKTEITDEEADVLLDYQKAKEEYQEKVREIEEQYLSMP